MEFETDFKYTDRESKYKYVSLKYKDILKGKILDVGGDQGYLKQFVDDKSVSYTGVGYGDGCDFNINLDKEEMPFEDNSFDCVLCLDVLEHLEEIHQVFDDLCRITKKFVVIALPNPWGDFWGVLRHGQYIQEQPMKFYGLPPDKPEDRHRWFYSREEAEKFISHRAKLNNMNIIHQEYYGDWHEKWNLRRFIRVVFLSALFSKGLNLNNLNPGKLWVVLEKAAVE